MLVALLGTAPQKQLTAYIPSTFQLFSCMLIRAAYDIVELHQQQTIIVIMMFITIIIIHLIWGHCAYFPCTILQYGSEVAQ